MQLGEDEPFFGGSSVLHCLVRSFNSLLVKFKSLVLHTTDSQSCVHVEVHVEVAQLVQENGLLYQADHLQDCTALL